MGNNNGKICHYCNHKSYPSVKNKNILINLPIGILYKESVYVYTNENYNICNNCIKINKYISCDICNLYCTIYVSHYSNVSEKCLYRACVSCETKGYLEKEYGDF